MQREIIALVIGIAAGVILTLVITSYTGSGNRYCLHASSDGKSIHKIDSKTGRVWWKNSYVELDADGQPVTIWYWEELTLDRPGAASLAEDLQSSTEEARQEELTAKRAAATEMEALKQKRLNEIYIICGEDLECVKQKCAAGFGGTVDTDWTSYCSDQLKTHVINIIIDQCRADAGCIKTYCVNKYNNTYPAVSDCISEINLQKVKNESEEAGQPASE
ncbi:MAG: hypothetical protein RIG61_11870 [Deltaproteobacteria bacterium]